MALARIGNRLIAVRTTTPTAIVPFADEDRQVTTTVFLLTVHNPNTAGGTITFTIQRRVRARGGGDEEVYRLFRDIVSAQDQWVFGSMGGKITVLPDQQLEIVLVTAPSSIPFEVSAEITESL